MNSDDEPQPQPQAQSCSKCPAPVAKGYLGLKTGMCLPCTRASLGITEPEPQTSSSQEKASDTNELESSLGYQSGAEIYVSNQAGSFSTGDEKSVHGAGKSSGGHKRRVRPMAAKGGDGVKLTPACPSCKRAKIRCTHRRALGEEENAVSFDGSIGESEVPPSVIGKKVRLRLNPEVEGKTDAESNHSPSKRHTRGANRKRARMEEDDSQDTNGLSGEAISGGDGARDPSKQQQQPHPQKRSRRGRKPKNDRPADDTEESSDTIPPPIYESARPRFGANSLEGAGLLSRHVVLSRELQQKLQDCDTKWLAAIESLHEAKRTLDTWVAVWQSGL